MTPGQTHHIHGARYLLASTSVSRVLIGDSAYDADDLRHFLASQGMIAVIWPMPNRTHKPDFDAVAYKQWNCIYRAFCRLKDWRAIAIGYEKAARIFLAGIRFAVAVNQRTQ